MTVMHAATLETFAFFFTFMVTGVGCPLFLAFQFKSFVEREVVGEIGNKRRLRN